MAQSSVWNDFIRVSQDVGGGEIKILGECKICHKLLSADPKAGTGHLRRHAYACKANRGGGTTQAQVQHIVENVNNLHVDE